MSLAGRDLTIGYSDRVVWLVANHEHAEIDEPDLSALIAADNSGFASAAG